MAGVISQGSYIKGLLWMDARRGDLSTYLPDPKRFYRGLNWFQSHLLSRWSQHQVTLKDVSLEQLLGVGKTSRTHILKIRKEVRSLQLLGFSS